MDTVKLIEKATVPGPVWLLSFDAAVVVSWPGRESCRKIGGNAKLGFSLCLPDNACQLMLLV
jgi:hypothetical protein